MGSKAAFRSINASIKRAERNAQRRRRELQKQQVQIAKMQEQQRNQYEVEVYENYIELITSVHKECSEPWDWEAILQSADPEEPEYLHDNEQAARMKLERYTPGFFDKLFAQDKKKLAMLSKAVEAAKQKDQAIHDEAIKQYHEERDKTQAYKEVASQVIARDLDGYAKAIQLTNPFSDIQGVGSHLQFSSAAPWYLEATLKVNSEEVIPKQEKSLTSTGKLSAKAIPAGRRNEIYQDYVCGCALRVARELFALLPIDMVIVHAMGEMLNSSTGYLELQTILSVAIPRSTLSRLNFETIDCSDSLKNFSHAMSFVKAKGFAPIERISSAVFMR